MIDWKGLEFCQVPAALPLVLLHIKPRRSRIKCINQQIAKWKRGNTIGANASITHNVLATSSEHRYSTSRNRPPSGRNCYRPRPYSPHRPSKTLHIPQPPYCSAHGLNRRIANRRCWEALATCWAFHVEAIFNILLC